MKKYQTHRLFVSPVVTIAAVIVAIGQATPVDNAAGWVQAGGLLAFAGAVLWELRQQRNERRISEEQTRDILTELSKATTALLERHRQQTAPIMGQNK